MVPRLGTKSQGFLLGVSEELETLCHPALSRVYRTRSRHSEPLTSSSCRGRSKEKTCGYGGPILSGPLPHAIGSVQSPGQGAVLHFKVRLSTHEHGLLRGEAGTQTRVVDGRTQAQTLAVKGSWGQKGNN